LRELDPRQHRIVELKFFYGFEHEEIAELLGISETTSKREWRAAKLWLLRELSQT
jgi:RNA polymerase sigma factor (sigma-70 family)